MCCAPDPCVGGALTRKDSPLLSLSPCFSSFAPAPPPQHPPGSAGPSPWTKTPACCQQPPTQQLWGHLVHTSMFSPRVFSSLKTNPPASIPTVLKGSIPHVTLKKCSKYRVTPVYIVKKMLSIPLMANTCYERDRGMWREVNGKHNTLKLSWVYFKMLRGTTLTDQHPVFFIWPFEKVGHNSANCLTICS